MKITGFCIPCVEALTTELGAQTFDPPVPVANYSLQVQDVPFYEFTCVNGHKASFVLQQMRHETLAAIGISALSDGYFRDAVGSMAAAVERFHEAFIRAAWISLALNDEDVQSAWKQVAAQSERQLGLFIGSYASAFRCAPRTFPPNQVTFRNSVIHKGHIPSLAEATAYAQACIDHIRAVTIEAQDLPNEGWSRMIAASHAGACVRAFEATGSQPISLFVPTILSDLVSTETVGEYLERTVHSK